MKNETIIRVWLFLHYPIWLPTWQVKIVLVKTLETLVRDRVEPEIDFWIISRNQRKELICAKYKEKLCSTNTLKHFSKPGTQVLVKFPDSTPSQRREPEFISSEYFPKEILYPSRKYKK